MTMRLDADLIGRFSATGIGWQSWINEALRKTAEILGTVTVIPLQRNPTN